MAIDNEYSPITNAIIDLKYIIANNKQLSVLYALAKKHHFFIAVIVSLLILTTGLVLTHYNRGYSSDDVANQVIVGIWRQGVHDRAFFATDNFIIKIPLYYVMQLTPFSPRAQLLVTSLILNITGFILFAIAVRYFLTKVFTVTDRLMYAGLIWIAGVGSTLLIVLSNPNQRNVEIGIVFMLLMYIAKYVRGEIDFNNLPKKILMLVSIIGLGLFIYNDPYYLYVLILPLAVLIVAYWFLFRFSKRELDVVLFFVGAFLAYILWDRYFTDIGIISRSAPVYFIAISKLIDHINILIQGTLHLFNADLFGQKLLSATTIKALIALPLIAIIYSYPFILLRKGNIREGFWKVYFALLPLYVSTIFVLNNYIENLGSSRYLFIIVFVAVIIIGLVFTEITSQRLRIVFALLLTANIATGLFSFYEMTNTTKKNPNDSHLPAITVAAQNNLTKGYTDFWEANIRTYLTGNTINFIAVVCGDDNRLYTHRWLTDIGISKKEVNSSFYYYNPQRRYTQDCTPEIIPKQFGNPVETIDVGGSKLLIFDYDIGEMIR